jgi:hypothetical protein
MHIVSDVTHWTYLSMPLACVISGTPTGTQAATSYTITATNAFGNGTASINITVNSAGTAPTVSYSGSPFTFTQNSAITTVSPTLGGSAPTGCSSSPALPTGLSINATSCAISGTPTGTQAASSYTITATNAYGNGTVNINITVTAAGTAPTVSYSGSPFTYTQNSAITTLTPTLGGNTPTSCSSSPSLPSGLSIGATTCVISGTPTGTQGATSHTITATNGFGNGTASINVTVNAAGTAPTVSYSGSPFTYTQNSAITTLTPTLGGSAPTGCASSPTLPTGLSINATSCAISGTPTGTQGATNHTITATNAFGSNTASINITVTGIQVVAPTFSLAAGHYNTAQTTTISTTTSGATVYFTTDGTTPTTSSNLSSNPIHIWSLAGKTVKAIATKSGLSDSSVTTLAGVYSYPPLKTGQTTVYATGDDGTHQTGVTRSYTGPTQHSTYTSDYTTTDNATGLVWKTCPQGLSGSNCGTGSAVQMNWTDAQSGVNGCNALNSANSGNGYAGIKTWRLPTRQELEILPDYSTSSPAINTTAFPATFANGYWSSTTYARNTTLAWYVYFGYGDVGSVNKTTNYYVRCASGL